jgi:hypothetical protein
MTCRSEDREMNMRMGRHMHMERNRREMQMSFPAHKQAHLIFQSIKGLWSTIIRENLPQ